MMQPGSFVNYWLKPELNVDDEQLKMVTTGISELQLAVVINHFKFLNTANLKQSNYLQRFTNFPDRFHRR